MNVITPGDKIAAETQLIAHGGFVEVAVADSDDDDVALAENVARADTDDVLVAVEYAVEDAVDVSEARAEKVGMGLHAPEDKAKPRLHSHSVLSAFDFPEKPIVVGQIVHTDEPEFE